jgi:C2 domain
MQSRNATIGPVVEIAVGGVALRRMDLLSRSDPFVVLYTRNPTQPPPPTPASRRSTVTPSDPTWSYHGETEVLWDALSPRFATRFILPDTPDPVQLRFELYDADTASASASLSAHDFIGQVTTSLPALLLAPRVIVVLTDRRARPRPGLGSLTVSVERYALPSRGLILRAGFGRGVGMPVGEAGFYVLARETTRPAADAPRMERSFMGFVVVHRSERVKGGAQFQEAVLSAAAVCGGDEGRGLVLEVYCRRKDGAHVLSAVSERVSLKGLRLGERGGVYGMLPGRPAAIDDGLTDGLVAAGEVRLGLAILPDGGGDKGSSVVTCRFTRLEWAPQREASKLAVGGQAPLGAVKMNGVRR